MMPYNIYPFNSINKLQNIAPNKKKLYSRFGKLFQAKHLSTKKFNFTFSNHEIFPHAPVSCCKVPMVRKNFI